MSFFTEWMARRHGGMAPLYEKFTAPLEEAGLAAVRASLACDLGGTVLEVGCGTGLNFAHYPAGAEVVAVEPLDDFRTFATTRAQTVAARVVVEDGDVQELRFPDHTFDAALETLAFCSVPDAARGLKEVRRVLKPGAPARFFEHVRSPHPFGALVQDLANPLWRRLMDGCNLNRDTVTAIAAAGFTIERIEAHEIRTLGAPRFPFREIRAHA